MRNIGLGVLSGLIIGLVGCSTLPNETSGRDTARPVSAPAQASTTAWFCDQLRVETMAQGEDLMLYVRDKSWHLQPTSSASGAKYQSAERPYTVFWQKGRTASFELEGQEMPNCVRRGDLPLPITARGNEPFWTLTINPETMSYSRMSQAGESELSYRKDASHTLRHHIQAEGERGPLTAMITQQVCRDTMTGMPYPYQARVTYGGEELRGCAGNPQQLLRGVEWFVQSMDGTAVGSTMITLNFLPNGQVAGHAGCNRFFGQYQLSGEGLQFRQMGSTRMACEPERMALEHQFLRLLGQATQVEIDTVGALILKGGDKHLRAFAF